MGTYFRILTLTTQCTFTYKFRYFRRFQKRFLRHGKNVGTVVNYNSPKFFGKIIQIPL